MSSGMSGSGRDDHQTFDELAVGWAIHALEPEDEAAFTAHLAGCSRCARTVAETHETMAALALELPPAEPSDRLRHRLRDAVQQTEQLQGHVEPPAVPPVRPAERAAARHPVGGQRPPSFADLRPPRPAGGEAERPPWRRVLPHALVAAAVAAILALGAWNVVLAGDRDAVRATAEQRAEMIDALLRPGRATIAPLTQGEQSPATVVARDGQVQVVATGLPVNDARNSTYVVWGVGEGSPVPLGTFDVVTPQMDLRTVGSTATGLGDYPAYAISAEPGRQAPAAPSDIVAKGQVTT
jgi:anti-sigma-K factor RskA